MGDRVSVKPLQQIGREPDRDSGLEFNGPEWARTGGTSDGAFHAYSRSRSTMSFQ